MPTWRRSASVSESSQGHHWMTQAKAGMPDMKLELVPVPVSDVDRAKAFYEKAGFKLGVDARPSDAMQITDFKGVKYAGFRDPDGNLWLLQEFPAELRRPENIA
jgi:hypothetical protein